MTSPNFAFAQTAQDDEYSVDEDNILTVGPIGVLENDTISPEDTVTAVIKTDVGIGVLTLNPDGSFEYTPISNFAGTTSFTYAIDNDGVESNEATVTINVNPVNDAPVTVDDAYSTPEDIALMIIGTGVLDNDEDEENNSLSAVLDTTTTDGLLVLNLDGSFEYTPNPNFVGSDSFTYHANDGTNDGNIGTVTINVISENDLPQAENDQYSTNESTILNVGAPGVLGNDSDPENDSLSAVLDTTTTNGVLVLNTDGGFDYTPNNDFVGTDSFSYHANDGVDNSNIATVSIQVNPQDSDSVIDSILEQIQMLFDKLFAVEDEVEKLKEQNAALESRVAALEDKISSGSSDDDDEHTDSKKVLKNEIKELKKEFKDKVKDLKNEYKEKERDLKDQIKDLKKDKKQNEDDDDEDEDDDD